MDTAALIVAIASLLVAAVAAPFSVAIYRRRKARQEIVDSAAAAADHYLAALGPSLAARGARGDARNDLSAVSRSAGDADDPRLTEAVDKLLRAMNAKAEESAVRAALAAVTARRPTWFPL